MIASDPDPSRHPVRLTPSAIEYKADIETATHCALPEAADYDTWAQLVRIGAGLIPDREIPAHEAQRVINKVAPEYRKRELYNIKKYFTHVRKRVA